MHIHIHMHKHEDNEVLKTLLSINQKLSKLMTKQEFQDALNEVTTSLDNIAADITRLTDQLQTGGLTEAEENDIFTQLRAVADRAKAIADSTPEDETPQP